MDRYSKCTLGVQAPRVQIIRHRWKKNNEKLKLSNILLD